MTEAVVRNFPLESLGQLELLGYVTIENSYTIIITKIICNVCL